MKNLVTAIILSLTALAATAGNMNSKEFHLLRTENMRVCQPGVASTGSNGLVCGGGVGGINPVATIIDTRSDEEKNSPPPPAVWYQFCRDSMTFVAVQDYNASTRRPAPQAGCKMVKN